MPANVELLQADGRHLPFDSTFDLAGAFDVLEHIAEDEAVMAGINKVPAPGGILSPPCPQHPFLWGPTDEVAHRKSAVIARANWKRNFAGPVLIYRLFDELYGDPVAADDTQSSYDKAERVR